MTTILLRQYIVDIKICFYFKFPNDFRFVINIKDELDNTIDVIIFLILLIQLSLPLSEIRTPL